MKKFANEKRENMFRKKQLAQILDGCLSESKTFTHGTYRGYPIIIDLRRDNGRAVYNVRISATAPSPEASVALTSFLEGHKNSVRHKFTYACHEHFTDLMIPLPNLAKQIPAALNDAVVPAIQYMTMQGFTCGCQNCGDTTAALDYYQINDTHQMLCADCSHKVAAILEDNKSAVRSQKSSLIPGLVGAFLGSLIGALLWIGIYKLGYIAGIAGAVTVICALKGYEKFGGALDIKGVLISVAISAVIIYFSNNIAWAWEAYDALKDYGYTFSETYRSLGDILSESEMTTPFYTDLAIGYFLTLVCSIGTIINALRSSSGSYKMRKVR